MRAFGYICPQCGKPAFGIRSEFAIMSSRTEIACECGKSALSVEYDGVRYRVSVPCGLCGETHFVLCPPERMLHGSTAFNCAKVGQFSCFIGLKETVEQRLSAAVESKESNEESIFSNNIIMYEILSELKDIAARPDGITCCCGSHRYSMEIRRAAVDLICNECGSKLRIPAGAAQDLVDLCCHMKLIIPGRVT